MNKRRVHHVCIPVSHQRPPSSEETLVREPKKVKNMYKFSKKEDRQLMARFLIVKPTNVTDLDLWDIGTSDSNLKHNFLTYVSLDLATSEDIFPSF